MKGKVFYMLFLPYFVSVLCKVNQDTVDQNIVVTQVERKIDISSHVVKTYTSITIENKGSSTVRSFLYVVDPSLKTKLSFIGAVVSGLHLHTLYCWHYTFLMVMGWDMEQTTEIGAGCRLTCKIKFNWSLGFAFTVLVLDIASNHFWLCCIFGSVLGSETSLTPSRVRPGEDSLQSANPGVLWAAGWTAQTLRCYAWAWYIIYCIIHF